MRQINCLRCQGSMEYLGRENLQLDTGVTLDKFHNLRADIFVGVGRNRDAVVSVLHHLDCYVHCLEQVVFVDAGEDEAALVSSLHLLQ